MSLRGNESRGASEQRKSKPIKVLSEADSESERNFYCDERDEIGTVKPVLLLLDCTHTRAHSIK